MLSLQNEYFISVNFFIQYLQGHTRSNSHSSRLTVISISELNPNLPNAYGLLSSPILSHIIHQL